MFNWPAAMNHYRDGGPGRVFEVLCARGLVPGRLLYYHEVGVFRLHAVNQKVIKRRAKGYDYGIARKQDAEELAIASVCTNVASLTRFFEAFFDAGNRCFVVRKNGAIVGYNWACQSRYTLTNDNYRDRQLHLSLQPNEVVFGNGYIHPDYRMKGLFPGLVRTAVDAYPKDTAFYSTVARLNDVSVKSHLRLGFELRLRVSCHRVGTWPYFWTVREPGKRRRWVGWNQPTTRLEALFAGGAGRCHEPASTTAE